MTVINFDRAIRTLVPFLLGASIGWTASVFGGVCNEPEFHRIYLLLDSVRVEDQDIDVTSQDAWPGEVEVRGFPAEPPGQVVVDLALDGRIVLRRQ